MNWETLATIFGLVGITAAIIIVGTMYQLWVTRKIAGRLLRGRRVTHLPLAARHRAERTTSAAIRTAKAMRQEELATDLEAVLKDPEDPDPAI